MPRPAAPVSTVLLALLLGVTVSAPAGAASAFTGGASLFRSADDLGAVPVPVDEADPEDEPIGVELGDLCGLLDDAGAPDDASDDSADDAAVRAADDGADDTDDADPADETDPVDEPEDGLGCDDGATAGDAPDEAADGGTGKVSLANVLKRGALDTGSVSLSGPGTVTQEVWLTNGRSSATPRVVAASARKRTAAKRKARGTTGGKILGGSVTRTVRKAGVVHLTIRLNTAARRQLRKSKKDVRITVKTTTKLKGAKARTRTGTLVLKRKGAV
ncbi:MAG: hypothetical protein JWN65_41 [Solirubrobacterales bacterium]|nr:hypothetical protein [Solirubrobacterales bacterium]